ncbi:hypothetical protein OROGR_030795 [Orobanche gracilis]
MPFKGCTNFPVVLVGKDRDELPVPDLSLCTPDSKNSRHGITNSIGFSPRSCSGRSGPCATNFLSNLKTGHHQSARKQRRCWSPELHRRFIDALPHLGGAKAAMPRPIRDLMQVHGLTNDEAYRRFDYIIRGCRACGLGCNFQFQWLMESMRVIGDEICYRAKDFAVELMLVDALVGANNYLQIASHIQDPSQYWKFDDTIFKTIETVPDQELKESRESEYSVPKDKLKNFRNITAQDIVCSQNGGVSLREADVMVSNIRIDLPLGRHNPLESIKFSQDYGSEDKFSITDDGISHLLPTYYQDMIVRVYSKKPELIS